MSREDQTSLVFDLEQSNNATVTCLGIKFKNDEERKAYFRNELRKRLPERKKKINLP